MDFNPNLDDPKTQLLVTMGLGLLGGAPGTKRNFGADMENAGLLGMKAYGGAKQAQLQQQTAERANRASDLQELTGLQSALYANEFPQMMQQGASYVPSQQLQSVNKRLMDLAMGGNYSGKGAPIPGSAPVVSAPSAPQMPQQPPVGQNFQGANPGFDPSLLPQQAPQLPAGSASGAPMPAAGGMPMPIWLGASRAGPGAMAFLQQYAKEGMPINARAGSSIVTARPGQAPQVNFYAPQLSPGVMPQRDAAGNLTGASAIPGYSDATAGIKGAETSATERAKAPFDIKMVTTGSGATVPMSVEQLMNRNGPSSGGLPFVSQPKIPPAVQAAAAKGQPFEATQTPSGQVTVTNPTQGQQDPWATIPKIQVPQGLGQTTYGKGIADKQAAVAQDTAQELGTNASAAAQRIAINNQAKDLVDKADTGWMATHLGEFRNILGTLGVKSAADMAANDAILAKDLTNTALQKGKQLFGSRFTQSEVGIMLSRANPSPEMQKTAIKFLLDTDNATQEYATQQAQDFGRYYQSGGDPFQFKGWYASKFPLTKQLQGISLGKEPQNIDDLVKRYYRPQ